MRKAFPFWPAALLPATLVGHAGAYAFAGRTMADGHHAWLGPVFELSCAALLLLCMFLVGSALSRSADFVQLSGGGSFLSLWPRMALAQAALFVVIERSEGAHVTVAGLIVQLIVALCAAYLLAVFARLITRCIASAREASCYLERLVGAPPVFATFAPVPRRAALLAAAGPNLFQRPPPHQ